jgi:hypothetical protein
MVLLSWFALVVQKAARRLGRPAENKTNSQKVVPARKRGIPVLVATKPQDGRFLLGMT